MPRPSQMPTEQAGLSSAVQIKLQVYIATTRIYINGARMFMPAGKRKALQVILTHQEVYNLPFFNYNTILSCLLIRF